MPVRMLREGIIDSEAVNSLTAEAEVFYRRLMSVVDDFGRFDARPLVLRSRLYPLRIDNVFEVDIAKWLDDCRRAGLIRTYEVDGKPYLEFFRLGSPRAKVSKYPPPPEQACQSERKQPEASENDQTLQMNADENGCAQTHASAPYSYSDSRPNSDSRPRPTSCDGRSETAFDPLRESERARKEFVEAWNAAGLMPLKRLTHGLHSKLDALLLDSHWAATWREALARAGKSPFLAKGEGSRSGPMDPGQFLRDDDFAASILRGKYDPRAGPEPATTRTRSQLEGDRILEEARRKRGLTP